jgi:hypothetical protein
VNNYQALKAVLSGIDALAMNRDSGQKLLRATVDNLLAASKAFEPHYDVVLGIIAADDNKAEIGMEDKNV